jgi:hypothetical protein
MRTPPRIPVGRLFQILAVLALLAIIVNPELRVLIFFVDTIGLELAILLLTLQARVILAALALATHLLVTALCRAASGIGHSALAAFPAKVNSCKLHRVLCPTLIGLSYGLRCRAVPRAN